MEEAVAFVPPTPAAAYGSLRSRLCEKLVG